MSDPCSFEIEMEVVGKREASCRRKTLAVFNKEVCRGSKGPLHFQNLIKGRVVPAKRGGTRGNKAIWAMSRLMGILKGGERNHRPWKEPTSKCPWALGKALTIPQGVWNRRLKTSLQRGVCGKRGGVNYSWEMRRN